MEIVVAEKILAVEILLIHHIYQMESWIISNTLVIDGLNALLLGMETYSDENPMQSLSQYFRGQPWDFQWI